MAKKEESAEQLTPQLNVLRKYFSGLYPCSRNQVSASFKSVRALE